jgi:hypothetical protein
VHCLKNIDGTNSGLFGHQPNDMQLGLFMNPEKSAQATTAGAAGGEDLLRDISE